MKSTQHGVITRPRLEDDLDRSNARLLLLDAPAGYGKSTIARQWLSRPNRACGWYVCRPGVSDVSSLASAIAATISSALGIDLGSVVHRIRASQNASREPDILASLLYEHIPSWPQNWWLVIDDYEHLIGNPACEEFIEALLAHDDARAIVATRMSPRWASVRRVIYGEIFRLDGSHLAFTDDEARLVFDGFGSDEADSILPLADGWPAIVNLLARGPKIHLRRGAALRHFVADEVCKGLEPPVLQCLSVLSVLPPQPAHRLPEIAGKALATRTRRHGLNRGILVELHDGTLDVHAVVRRYFEERGQHGAVESAPNQFVRRAGQLMVAARDWDNVFALVERFNDARLFARMIEAALREALDEGRVDSVRRWVEFGREMGFAGDELTAAEAEIALRDGHYLRAELLARTLGAAEHGTKASKARAYMTAGRSAHLAGREEEALAYYRLARGYAPGSDARRRALWAELAVASDLELDEAWQMLARLERSHRGTADEQVRISYSALLLGIRFGTFAALAQARLAREVVDRVEDPFLRTAFRNVFAYVCALVGDYSDALDELDRLENDANRMKLTFVRPYAQLARAVVATGLSDFESAFAYLDCACDEASGQDGFAMASAAAIRARALLSLASYEDALAFAQLEIRPLARSMRAELLATQSVGLACLGEGERALALAENAQHISRAVEVPFLGLAAQTIVAHRRAEANAFEAGARELLLRARELSYVDGLLTVVRAYPDIGRAMARDGERRDWLRDVLVRSNEAGLVATLGFGLKRGSREAVLSPREAEVLSLVKKGMTNRQIADALFISEGTVKSHVHRTYEKLGVRNRTEAALASTRA